MCHSPYGAWVSWLEQSILDKIVEHVPPISIDPWGWGGPSRFYGKRGAFMYTMPNREFNGKQGYSVWIGAKTEQRILFLEPYIDKDWEYVAV